MATKNPNNKRKEIKMEGVDQETLNMFLEAAVSFYSQELSRRIKEGIRKSRERKEKNSQTSVAVTPDSSNLNIKDINRKGESTL